jgi:hypothetical protein
MLFAPPALSQSATDANQLRAAIESLDSRVERQGAEMRSLKEELARARSDLSNTNAALAKANNELTKAINDLAQLRSATPPVGTVLAFFGRTANLTSNWVLCDGRATEVSGWPQLPDLRGKFLRAADDRDTSSRLGSTGGRDTIPNHWHQVSGSSSDVSFDMNSLNGWIGSYSPIRAADGGVWDDSQTIVAHQGRSSHGHSGGAATFQGRSDHDGGHDNRPAFVSVNFVCRVQ